MAAKKKSSASQYSDDDITVLSGLEPVRHRPSMYVGDIADVNRVLFNEAIDNATDEAQAGHADEIIVSLDDNDSRLTVQDNGRGVPIGMHKKAKNADGSQMSTMKAILTILHAGGKFDSKNYGGVSGGLHGVGISVACALSTDMTVTSCRDGKVREFYAIGSVPAYWDDNSEDYITDENYDSVLRNATKDDAQGTTVSFCVDHTIPALEGYGKKFDKDAIQERLRELSFLVLGCTYIFQRNGKEVARYYAEESKEHFVEMLADSGYKPFHEEPVFLRVEDGNKYFDACFSFTESVFKGRMKAYTNTISNRLGGTHVEGIFEGIHSAFVDAELSDENKTYADFEQEDISKGVFGILHIGIDNPAYAGQVKDRLVTRNAQELCAQHAYDMVNMFIENYPDEALTVAKAAQYRFDQRKKNNKLKELETFGVDFTGSSGTTATILAPGFTDCSSKVPAERELYIVEGDSASGNIRKMNCKRTQALQKLKGKIINVAKRADDQSVLKNPELSNIIEVIGAGIEDFCEAKKSRFHKIIICADADPDGKHIRAELMAFFNIKMRPLVEAGFIYVVVPPLFGATNRKQFPDYTAYGSTMEELVAQIEEVPVSTVYNTYAQADMDRALKGWSITRFKGLGEMSDIQTEETILHKEDRILIQIQPGDLDYDSRVVFDIMGDDSTERRRMIGGVPCEFGSYEPVNSENSAE